MPDALEFLSLKEADQKKHHVVLLTGKDALLRRLVIETLEKSSGIEDTVESYQAKDGRSIVGLLEEGSVFGPAFMIVEVPGKPKDLDDLLTSLKTKHHDDYVVILSEKSWEMGAESPIAEILCENPKDVEARQTYCYTAARAAGLVMLEEAASLLATNADIASIDNVCRVIGLALPPGSHVTKQHVANALPPSEFQGSLMRAMLTADVHGAWRLLEGLEPVAQIERLHRCVRRMHLWVAADESEEGQCIQLLKIRGNLRDWRAMKQKYRNHAKPLRETLERLEVLHGDAMSGKPSKPAILKLLCDLRYPSTFTT